MALPYSEGTVFLVPLTNGGYARGVIARAAPKGRILLGYFFGPRLTVAESASFVDLHPNNAIQRLRFGDLGLISGEWPIHGKVHDWDRLRWKMPEFVRRDEHSKKAWLVEYADDNPGQIVAENPVDFNSPYESDSLFGCAAVQILLTKLLGSMPMNTDPDDSKKLRRNLQIHPIHHYLYFLNEETGKKVADILKKQGFIVDDRLGADDMKWLVLVKSDAAPTSATIEAQGKYMEQIAEENNGEYDGWEADGTHI